MGPAVIALAAYQAWAGAQAAEMNERNGKIQRDVNELEAKYIDMDAFNAEAYGYSEVAAYDPTVSKTIADQRTELAAHDVDLTYGTAAAIQEETRQIGEFNKMEIESQAHAKSLGLKQQARNVRLNGSLGQIANQNQSASMQAQGFANAAQTGIRAYSRT